MYTSIYNDGYKYTGGLGKIYLEISITILIKRLHGLRFMKLLKTLLTALLLLLVLSPTIPTTSAEEQPTNIYVKYKYMVDISSSDGQKAHVVLYVDYYLNFSEDSVIVKLVYLRAEVSAVLTTSPYSTQTTITPPPDQSQYTVVIPMNEYYSRLISQGLTGGTPSTEPITGIGGGVNTWLGSVVDVSYEDYNGYPAIHYRISGSASMFSMSYDFNGDIYLHTGYLLPLYIDVRMTYTGGGGFETTSSGTGHIKLEIIDTNLPKKSVVADKDMGSLEIVTGGFPGARISVRGEKGSDKLIVANDGTQPGYVAIIYKGRGSSLAVIGQTDTGNVELYDVPPGTNKTIALRTPLPENVDVSTQEVTGGLPLASYIYILIFAAIIAGLAWILLRLIRMKPEQKAETPIAPETPETIEPGGEQPIQ